MELAIQLILTAFMLAVVVYDVTRYIIPNKLNLLFLCFFVIMAAWLYPSVDLASSAMAFGILLVIGFTAFAAHVVGGGDVKLLAVCGLYLGLSTILVKFTVYMGLLGGALSLILLVGRWIAPMIGSKMGATSIPRLFSQGEPVPYGLAIAGAFMIIVWGVGLPYLG
ncbi:MAG: prepilin peptidase [Rickettsiales bacterium]|nr:prepilin peptidase [Rickettsiales bacterium]